MNRTKKSLLTLFTLLLVASSGVFARTYYGSPRIVVHGPAMTSTSGTLYCSGSVMALCCDVIGTRIYIYGKYQFWADCGGSTGSENGDSEHEFENAERPVGEE